MRTEEEIKDKLAILKSIELDELEPEQAWTIYILE